MCRLGHETFENPFQYFLAFCEAHLWYSWSVTISAVGKRHGTPWIAQSVPKFIGRHRYLIDQRWHWQSGYVSSYFNACACKWWWRLCPASENFATGRNICKRLRNTRKRLPEIGDVMRLVYIRQWFGSDKTGATKDERHYSAKCTQMNQQSPSFMAFLALGTYFSYVFLGYH